MPLNEKTFELCLSNTYSVINELRVWGKCCIILTHLEQFSYDLGKWFRQVFVICFISQWMKRSKHGLFVLPPNKILIWRRHCLIGKSCCSMTSKRSIRLISRKFLSLKFFDERLLDQPKATRVCIRSINQSNRTSSVRSLFSGLFARFHFQVIRKSL